MIKFKIIFDIFIDSENLLKLIRNIIKTKSFYSKVKIKTKVFYLRIDLKIKIS